MPSYPDWVKTHRRKGTTVKKVGNSYYLYRSTSKRVPGMKYPQPVQSFLGTITEDGFTPSLKRKVSTETVQVFEYGFSYTLSKIVPEKFMKDIGSETKANYAFLNIVRQFSPDSYLLRGIDLPTMDELHMSLCAQTKKFERLAGVGLRELLPLTKIYLVEAKECDMISAVTPEMTGLMAGVGVSLSDVQE